MKPADSGGLFFVDSGAIRGQQSGVGQRLNGPLAKSEKLAQNVYLCKMTADLHSRLANKMWEEIEKTGWPFKRKAGVCFHICKIYKIELKGRCLGAILSL